MAAPKGLYVTFEGIDGTGKTTLALAVVKELRLQGIDDVCFTTQPSKQPAPLGFVFDTLLRQPHEISPYALALLFAADRYENMHTVVMPAVRRGGVVISDRSLDSAYVYQHYVQQVPLEDIRDINRQSQALLDTIVTHIRVYLVLDAKCARERLAQRTQSQTAFDADFSFQQKVAAAYETVYDGQHNVLRIDASMSIATQSAQVAGYILSKYSQIKQL